MSPTGKLRKYVLETYLFSSDESLLDNDDSFLDKGIIDSTGVIELIMFLEDEYGISVSDDELIPDNLDSINRLAAFIERKKAAA